jgi:hypothetical protein
VALSEKTAPAWRLGFAGAVLLPGQVLRHSAPAMARYYRNFSAVCTEPDRPGTGTALAYKVIAMRLLGGGSACRTHDIGRFARFASVR